MPRQPFSGSSRAPEGGHLVTAKQDFQAHIQGGSYRHEAAHTDMNPIIQALGGATVQKTLEQMAAYLASQGTGFISIGKVDGYDGYGTGVFSVGAPATPTLSDAFTAAFADDRLQNGGVILLIAGTYQIRSQVSVPPGITIMGELSGSIISGEIDGQSMFKVLQGNQNVRIGGDSGSGTLPLEAGGPLDVTKFVNLILSDNLDGYIQSGGVAVSAMQSVPMIECEKSSQFVCENCRFIGRVNDGPVSGRDKTLQAVGGYTSGGGTATYLTLRDCFFDGMRTVAAFTPGNGDIDHLIVNACRARTFGTEDALLTDPEDNCFVSMSLCSATLVNNYHVGYGTWSTQRVESCFVVSSRGGGTDDVKVIVSGNSGGPSSGIDTRKSVYYNNVGAITAVKALVTGNNWGSGSDNGWYVTVGDGSSLASGTFGDFVGAGAIDLVLNSSFAYPLTVIVNSGTYNITTQDGGRYNFIGNVTDSNNKRPIFSLNLDGAAATDAISNRYFAVGSYIKSIHFKSDIGVTAEYHSVRPTIVAGTQEASGVVVEDCMFEDVSLVTDTISSLTQPATANISVLNCRFSQTGDYADKIGMLLPSAENVLVEGCKFTGNGYVGGIGSVASISFTHSANIANKSFVVRNCTMDLDGETITAYSPVTGVDNYFFITDDAAKVVIDNCQILAANDLTTATPIAGGLTAFDAFVYVESYSVDVNSCVIHGPQQTHVPSVNTVPMPALKLTTDASIRLLNNRFTDGGLPVQITGGFTATRKDGIVISGNEFSCTSGGAAGVAMTLLDIDMDLSAAGDHTPNISVTNNRFQALNEDKVYEVEHAGGGTYNAQGIVQIYANFFEIDFSNNKVYGHIMEPTADPFSLAHFAGVVINNYDSTSNSGSNICPITFANNQIRITNAFTTATAADSASAVWIRGTTASITGNFLNTVNDAGVLASIITCLYIDIRDVVGTTAESLVSNNIFSRRRVTGLVTVLNVSYVYIDGNNEAPGLLTNNIFEDPTPDSSATTVVDDQSSIWLYYNNKNQTDSLLIRGHHGSIGLGNQGLDSVVVGLDSDIVDSVIRIDDTGTTGNVYWNYNDTTKDQRMRWLLPLFDILPYGVTVTEVTVDVNVSATPSTTSVALLTLSSVASGSETDTDATLTVGESPQTLTVTAGSVHRNLPSQVLTVALDMRILESTTPLSFFADQMTITYRW